MSDLPAGVAAFIAVCRAGTLIFYSGHLTLRQKKTAKLMALTALVRNHTFYALILETDLREVCRLAA